MSGDWKGLLAGLAAVAFILGFTWWLHPESRKHFNLEDLDGNEIREKRKRENRE